jgi:hypothetical protein
MMEVEVSAMLNREFELPFVPFVVVALVVLCSLGVLIDTASRYEPLPPIRSHGCTDHLTPPTLVCDVDR